MTFVDYCIETRNYSALSCINEYTKIFASAGPRVLTNPGVHGENRHKLAKALNDYRHNVKNSKHLTTSSYNGGARAYRLNPDLYKGPWGDEWENEAWARNAKWNRDQVAKEISRMGIDSTTKPLTFK